MNKLFCIFCIIVFLFKTQTVFSNNLIYDVNNIEVSGKIDNDFDKKKIIQTAFQNAFTIFTSKTLLKKDASSLNKIKISTIEDLVFAYQIFKEEKNDRGESVLTVNIKFDQKKINNLLAKKSISYADVSNISLTLLPVFVKDKELFIFDDNFFYKNWLESKEGVQNIDDILISYNLALENIEDLQYINLNKENLDLVDVKKLTSFYEVNNYAFLLIYFAEEKFKAYIKTSISKKRIDKSINLKIYPNNEVKTYVEAILNLKEEISQIWKSQNLIDVNTPSFLDLFLDVKKTNDYLKLSLVLNSIDLIENYSVLEMTNDYTKVRIKYKGKVNKIKFKLLEKNFKINIVDNIWKIKVS